MFGGSEESVVGAGVGGELCESNGGVDVGQGTDVLAIDIALVPYIVIHAGRGSERVKHGGGTCGAARGFDIHCLAVACHVAVAVVAASCAVAHVDFHTDILEEIIVKVDGYLVPVAVEAVATGAVVAVPTIYTVLDTTAGYSVAECVADLLPLAGSVLSSHTDNECRVAVDTMTRGLYHDTVVDEEQCILDFNIHSIVQCFSFSLGTTVAQTDGFVDGGVVRGRAVGEVIGDQRVFAKL